MSQANTATVAGKSVSPSCRCSTEFGVPVAVMAIVIALITPMPGFLLDFLIVIDIMLSVIVMMVAVYIRRPVDFSVFPTMLLLLTLYRLALNISSARLILLNGNTGTSAAGHVIEAFGNFVVGGNYIIGTVIFLVLIAIQYVVINHGAVRISEVTARFTLDALPGKQMSIDADLNSGLIDETEARARRKQSGRRSRILRSHGRRLALHPARRRRQHPDHQHQHHRRIPDRRPPARHGAAARAPDLYRPHHRRRPGHGDSGADDFRLRRPDRHPHRLRGQPGRRSSEAGAQGRAAAAAGRRTADRSGRISRVCPPFRSCCWAAD